MIPKECKRLAEVDFPIAEVSRHSAREKSIRHDHPSTLHPWSFQDLIRNSKRFPWHQVKKVDHHWLSVDAVTQPMQVRDPEPPPYGHLRDR